MNKTLYIAALSLGLWSCSSNDTEPLASGNFPQDHVIRVTAGVNEPRSRAGYDATNLDRFGLIVTNSANDAYCYHKLMTGTGSTWNTADGQPMLWDADRTPVTVIAYAPYSETAGAGASVAVKALTDQSTAANVKESDFLVRKALVNPDQDLTADGKLKVTLDHAMSKLSIVITVNGSAAADMSKLGDVAINGAVTEGSCDFSATVPAVTATAGAAPATVTAFKGTETCECILPPQTIADGFSINFSYDGKLYVWNATDPVILDSGVEYTLTLNVNTTVRLETCTARNRATGAIIGVTK
ncbi:MAG: fimbrillin family protein [Muribaculaceae bacterium]|nr:fimbrillin family protein [Muribaculaceae bacterium]